MKKMFVYATGRMVTFVLVSIGIRGGPGKNWNLTAGAQGKVIFSGDTHKVNKCNDCHPDPSR